MSSNTSSQQTTEGYKRKAEVMHAFEVPIEHARQVHANLLHENARLKRHVEELVGHRQQDHERQSMKTHIRSWVLSDACDYETLLRITKLISHRDIELNRRKLHAFFRNGLCFGGHLGMPMKRMQEAYQEHCKIANVRPAKWVPDYYETCFQEHNVTKSATHVKRKYEGRTYHGYWVEGCDLKVDDLSDIDAAI